MFGATTDLQRRMVFSRSSPVRALATWELLFAAAICCAIYPHYALSKPVPIWAADTSENSDLPGDFVWALALGPDGGLWAGTDGGGLARLDKDGHWQTYNTASTKGGLPNDNVRALAVGPDSAL